MGGAGESAQAFRQLRWDVLALVVAGLLAVATQAAGSASHVRSLKQDCAYVGLRQLLRFSPFDGLTRCQYCTVGFCYVTCGTCRLNATVWGAQTTLDLTRCASIPGDIFVRRRTGELACRSSSEPAAPPDAPLVEVPSSPPWPPAPPPSPPTPPPAPSSGTISQSLTGEIQAFVSHLGHDTPEHISFSLMLTPSDDTTSPAALPLRLKEDIPLVTGDLVNVTVKVPVDSPAGRRLLAGIRGAAGGGVRGVSVGGGVSGAAHRRLLSDTGFDLSDLPELDVDSIEPAGPPSAPKDFVVNDQPVNITSITLIVTMCGAKSPLTKTYLTQRWFNYAAPANYVTLQNYHSTCSYNKLRFLPENNIIIDGIDIPCYGTWQGQTYDTARKCSTPETYGWMDEAVRQAQSKYNIDMSKYKRRILIMPFRSACPWGGLASVGCVSSCSTWINNGPKSGEISMPTLFQELGHNIGLMHSNRNVSWSSLEYGDYTDPMGSGGPSASAKFTTLSCPNAAQAWKAGWLHPIRNGNLSLDAPASSPTGFSDGTYKDFTIPAQALSDSSILRIKIANLPAYTPSPYWVTPQEQVLYVSYRVRQKGPGFDSGLANDMTGRVYVHSFNATARSPPRPDPAVETFKPTIVAVLDMANGKIKAMAWPVRTSAVWWWAEYTRGLRMWMISKDATAATMRLCSFRQRSENTFAACKDGLDNDCNGVRDADDPACAPFV